MINKIHQKTVILVLCKVYPIFCTTHKWSKFDLDAPLHVLIMQQSFRHEKTPGDIPKKIKSNSWCVKEYIK